MSFIGLFSAIIPILVISGKFVSFIVIYMASSMCKMCKNDKKSIICYKLMITHLLCVCIKVFVGDAFVLCVFLAINV